ncbi:MAG: hypothetical protein F6K06_31020 [Okeania sp. SIO1H4]|nr:hypothetical protein [Okeania sp. SIO1H4]NET23620.1 hypothetical protein [Okeania sp. SIO1H5]NET80310.1 hypothetical protein [Okeania sp. SIO1F9]NET97443.1 hypothetical protein [Okeania sp. SIO1H2]
MQFCDRNKNLFRPKNRRCTVTNDLIFLKETGDSYTGDRRKITWGENPHVMREHPR